MKNGIIHELVAREIQEKVNVTLLLVYKSTLIALQWGDGGLVLRFERYLRRECMNKGLSVVARP